MREMPFNEITYRQVAKDLCEWAVYGDAGVTEKSDRYKLVTEGRDPGPRYSSCADLAHWLLFRLGVRSHYLNRDEEPDENWEMDKNVSSLAFGPDARGCHGLVPKCGDILIAWKKPKGSDAHVFVANLFESAEGVLHSWDYGQAALDPAIWKPGSIEGRRRERAIRDVAGSWILPDGRIIQKILPLWQTLQNANARGELNLLYEMPGEGNA